MAKHLMTLFLKNPKILVVFIKFRGFDPLNSGNGRGGGHAVPGSPHVSTKTSAMQNAVLFARKYLDISLHWHHEVFLGASYLTQSFL